MPVVVENEYTAQGDRVTTLDVTSVVVTAAANRAIWCKISTIGKDAAASHASAVAWDPVVANEAFTLVGELKVGQVLVAMWRLLAATAKTAPVRVTWPIDDDNKRGTVVGVSVLNTVDQTTPHDTWQTPSSGTSTAPAHTVTSASGDYVMDVLAVHDAAATSSLTENGDGVQIYNLAQVELDAGSADLQAVGNASMAWTLGVSLTWVLGGVSINPAAVTVTEGEIMAALSSSSWPTLPPPTYQAVPYGELNPHLVS